MSFNNYDDVNHTRHYTISVSKGDRWTSITAITESNLVTVFTADMNPMPADVASYYSYIHTCQRVDRVVSQLAKFTMFSLHIGFYFFFDLIVIG